MKPIRYDFNINFKIMKSIILDLVWISNYIKIHQPIIFFAGVSNDLKTKIIFIGIWTLLISLDNFKINLFL